VLVCAVGLVREVDPLQLRGGGALGVVGDAWFRYWRVRVSSVLS
jgi:hypothetical protein